MAEVVSINAITEVSAGKTDISSEPEKEFYILKEDGGVILKEDGFKMLIEQEETNGNKTKAAEILGINRKTLQNKIKEYEIEQKSLRQDNHTFPIQPKTQSRRPDVQGWKPACPIHQDSG